MWILALLIVSAAVVLIAIRAARAVREAVEREKAKAQAEGKKLEGEYSWIGHIHGYWWALGSVVAGLKYIYKQWKTAPEGSPEKLGWGMLLALIVALAMFAVLKLIERKLNGRPIREEES
ncbi:MAG: hypothetical protein N3B12_01625 [Armatimonadetes bacterium]|nr:hypothetical protein [Armatimonadota bacterium]